MSNKIKVAINGFGRIGRALTKVVASDKSFELVAINDLNEIEQLNYLLKYDSVNRAKVETRVFDKNHLIINGDRVRVFNESNPEKLDFKADIVFECSGLFLTRDSTIHHIKKGAKRVILSAPPKDDTKSIVLGVNESEYAKEQIVSNASCTTNCVAPIVKILDDYFGVERGFITTTHAYSGSQSLVDSKHKSDFRRARAGALNIAPTTTGISDSLATVMPSMKNRFKATSLRVPTPNVSMADLNILLKKNVTIEELNDIFYNKSIGELSGILEIDTDFKVSSDILLNQNSSIIAKDLTHIIDSNFIKIMSWYDNEWGYSNRLADLAKYILKD